jgi:hypothetical protein
VIERTFEYTSNIMDVDSAATPGDLIALVREEAAEVRRHETNVMLLAAAWADAHPDLDPDHPANQPCDRYADTDPEEPDPRVPAVAWDAGAPFAAALGMATASGDAMIRDALVLRHRLPKLWDRVVALEVPVWRARRIAQAAIGRPDDVCRHLDERIAPVAEKVGPVIIDRLIGEAMMQLYPEQMEAALAESLDGRRVTLHEETLNELGVGEMTLRADWKDLHDFNGTVSVLAEIEAEADRAAGREPESLDVRRAKAIGTLADPAAAALLLEGRQPRKPKRHTTLFLHLHQDGVTGRTGQSLVGRNETTSKPVLEQQVREWCGRTDAHLTVVPVVDLTEHVGVDRYEIGDRLDTRVTLFHPTCVFPWCTRPARLCDKDHTVAHADGGPTCDCNLAPLCRRHHRLKTTARSRWHYRRARQGMWIWTDPHGQQFLRDDRGTTDITPESDSARCAAHSPPRRINTG